MGKMSVVCRSFQTRDTRSEGSEESLYHFQSKCLDWSEQNIDRYLLGTFYGSRRVLRRKSNHCPVDLEILVWDALISFGIPIVQHMG